MEWTPSATQLAALVPLAIVSVDVIQQVVHNPIERKGYPLPPGPTPPDAPVQSSIENRKCTGQVFRALVAAEKLYMRRQYKSAYPLA